MKYAGLQSLPPARAAVYAALCAALPFCLPAAHAQQLAYVTNESSNTVSAINLAGNSVVATIPVGANPEGIAVSPNGRFVYVTNSGGATVSVIDAVTRTVVGAVPVGNGPAAVAFTPNGNFAYVANGSDGTISVINTAAAVSTPASSVVATIPVGGIPCDIKITPNGAFAYVPNGNGSGPMSQVLSVISTATNTVTAQVALPLHDSDFVAVSADGTKVYAPMWYGYVAVVDTATNTVTSWSLNGGNDGISLEAPAPTPDGATVYVGAWDWNSVLAVSTATQAIASKIPVGTHPAGLAITPDGSQLYAVNYGDGTVSAIQTATNSVVATIPVGASPWAIAIGPAAQAPVVTLTGPQSSSDVYAENTPVPFAGSFTDAPGATHTATWTFTYTDIAGNLVSTSTAGTVSENAAGGGSVSASYSFASDAVYNVQLTVSNTSGLSGTANTIGGLPAIVVIYNPAAGFVTGGGWIQSNPGAYAPNPALTGNASFGFVAKYQNGATTPTGNTQFTFALGNLDFHSTSYQWLVVSGPMAQYKGYGTINGAGNYQFLLTARDGAVAGGGGTDGVRIKIIDSTGSTIIYDNMAGVAADDTNTTANVQALGGGSIQIHK